MTYEEIIKALSMQHVASFEREVQTEAAAILDVRLRYGMRKRRATKDDQRTALEDAQKFYADDVTRYLDGTPLDPQHTLDNRRAAVAWGVAQLLPPFWRHKAVAKADDVNVKFYVERVRRSLDALAEEFAGQPAQLRTSMRGAVGELEKIEALMRPVSKGIRLPETGLVQIFCRSMGKMLRVTAIYDNADAANAHMAKTDDALIAEIDGIAFLANKYDKGL